MPIPETLHFDIKNNCFPAEDLVEFCIIDVPYESPILEAIDAIQRAPATPHFIKMILY
jgi:hypothetical protein